VWTAPFLQGLMVSDAVLRERSCVRPVDAVVPLALMKSASRVPISLSSYDALTAPRSVPVAVPFRIITYICPRILRRLRAGSRPHD
jgi:hypothetical protein